MVAWSALVGLSIEPFVPQRIDRRQLRRHPRRIEPEKHADRTGEADRENDGGRVNFSPPAGKMADGERRADTEGDAHEAPDEGERHRFDEELQQDVPPARPHCHAQANLTRALGDRNQHDVHDADAADEQRHRGDRASSIASTARMLASARRAPGEVAKEERRPGSAEGVTLAQQVAISSSARATLWPSCTLT